MKYLKNMTALITLIRYLFSNFTVYAMEPTVESSTDFAGNITVRIYSPDKYEELVFESDGDVYYNGNEVKISENVTERAGIARNYSKQCLGGLPSEYTTLIEYKETNIETVELIVNMTDMALALLFSDAVLGSYPGSEVAERLFSYAAANTREAVALNNAASNTCSLSFSTYKNPRISIGANEYLKYTTSYYYSAGCQGYIMSEDYYELCTYI